MSAAFLYSLSIAAAKPAAMSLSATRPSGRFGICEELVERAGGGGVGLVGWVAWDQREADTGPGGPGWPDRGGVEVLRALSLPPPLGRGVSWSLGLPAQQR